MRTAEAGLPAAEELEQYRIWDSYFLPSDSGRDTKRLYADITETLQALQGWGFEKLCFFLNVGLGTADPVTEERVRANLDAVAEPLQRWPDRLLGMIRLNANLVQESLDAVDRWLREGPMVGVYFPGGNWGALSCNHPNFDPIVRRIAETGGIIMQHTWFKTGGKQYPGESTPADLAELAARHPDVSFICAHAGGEWQKGIRAVRSSPNILVETSGFDPTSGFIDMAVRELGAERVVFGSHLPSRSLGTELGKIFGARLTEEERKLILGGNLRRLLQPILK